MSDRDNRDQAFELLANARKWTSDCLEHVFYISAKFDVFRETLSDPQKVSYSVEPPRYQVVTEKTSAVSMLRVFYNDDMVRYDKLRKLLVGFRKQGTFNVLEQLHLSNAYHFEPIQYKGVPFITAIEAVYGITDFMIGQLSWLRSYSEVWLECDSKNDLDEHVIKDDSGYLVDMGSQFEDINLDLSRNLQSQLKMEEIRCKRWLYDRYGYHESPGTNSKGSQFENDFRFKPDQMSEYLGFASSSTVYDVIKQLGLKKADRGVKDVDYQIEDIKEIFSCIHGNTKRSKESRARAGIFLDDPFLNAERYLTDRARHLEYLETEVQNRINTGRRS